MEFSKTFKDALGREWAVEISTATLRRLAQPPLAFQLEEVMPAKVDVNNPQAAIDRYQKFIDDDLRFGDVVFAIVKEQADKQGVNQSQFEEGLKGGANQRAICAWHAAFTDFSHGSRKTILRSLQATMAKESRFHELVTEQIDAAAAAITDERMTAAISNVIQHAQHEQSGVSSPDVKANPF